MTEPALSLDNIFKLIEIVSIIGGGGIIAFKLGRASQTVEAATASTKEAITAQGKQIEVLQEDVRTLNKLVTDVALQGQRLDTQDRRLDAHDRTIEDLRRGEGFIYPLGSHVADPHK